MLAVQIKSEEEIFPRISSKRLFIFQCPGCQEVYFPRGDAEDIISKLRLSEEIVGEASLDYLCNRDFIQEYIKEYSQQIDEAQVILVFSCGVGAQVVSSLLDDKVVYTCCDTLYLNGFQGVTTLKFNCDQCGECYLNYTGGICPLTNCPKALLNGPCGGAREGKCEVNPDADCAWVLIYDRLKRMGKLDLLQKVMLPRDYSKIITESLSREKIER